MPNRPNDDGLRTSLDRLEGKLDSQSKEIQTVVLSIATLQTTVGKHTDEIGGLDHTINDIRTLIEERTSEGRTVTWKQLLMFAGLFSVIALPLMGGMLGLIGTGIVRWALPDKIETVVASSDKIAKNFSDRIEAKTGPINKQLAALDTNVATIQKTTTDTQTEIKSIVTALRPSVNRKSIVPRLNHSTMGNRKSVREKLPITQNLLRAVQTFEVPLERQDYKELSMRLYDQYADAKTVEEKSEFLKTFIAAANAKSVSEKKLHRPPDPSFAREKKAENYFEGSMIDLSSKEDWTGSVFKNCSIVISKPDKPVKIREVQFIDCTFDSIVETGQARDFLSTYLESTRPTVTFLGSKVQIVAYAVNNKWRKPR